MKSENKLRKEGWKVATSKSYEEELRELVLDEDKNIRWDAIREKYFTKAGNSWYPSWVWTKVEAEKVWDILLKENILSKSIDGNYLVFGCGITLNPRLYLGILYFTREEDARAYAELNYSGATYSADIIKCQKIEKGFDFSTPQ